MSNKRLFVEKKNRFSVEADSLLAELNENLGLGMKSLRLLNVYDLFGFSDALVEKCRYAVFGETVTDTVTDSIDLSGKKYLAVEYIPGQFDQRASSAVDCVHLIDPSAEISIRSSRLLIFDETVTDEVLGRIAHYYINPVECRRKDLGMLSLNEQAEVKPLEDLGGFIDIKAVIGPGVIIQPICYAGALHELPGSGSPHRRLGVGPKATFHNGQIRQIPRQTALVEDLTNIGKIFAATGNGLFSNMFFPCSMPQSTMPFLFPVSISVQLPVTSCAAP